MEEFLNSHHTNHLLIEVRHDLKQPVMVGYCKALGIICYFITAPLWSMIDNIDIHIFELHNVYLQLANFLNSTSDHIEELTVFLLSKNEHEVVQGGLVAWSPNFVFNIT